MLRIAGKMSRTMAKLNTTTTAALGELSVLDFLKGYPQGKLNVAFRDHTVAYQ